jgi:hypothetical protein
MVIVFSCEPGGIDKEAVSIQHIDINRFMVIEIRDAIASYPGDNRISTFYEDQSNYCYVLTD